MIALPLSHIRRRRRSVGAAMLATFLVLLGIVVFETSVPRWVRTHAGDLIVCVFIYLAAAFVFVRASPLALGVATFALACGVEFLQLARTPMLDAARSHRIGQIVLGNSFDVLDIVYYFAGTLLAIVLDVFTLCRFDRLVRGR